MKVKDLKKLLADADDEMLVLMPLSAEFDGYFKSPCSEDSGVSTLGLSDVPGLEEEDSFVIVPCGFFQQTEEAHNHELN